VASGRSAQREASRVAASQIDLQMPKLGYALIDAPLHILCSGPQTFAVTVDIRQVPQLPSDFIEVEARALRERDQDDLGKRSTCCSGAGSRSVSRSDVIRPSFS